MSLIKPCISFLIIVLLIGAVRAEVIHITNIQGYSHNGSELKELQQLIFDNETGELLSATPEVLKKATVIDGQGRFVLPGLHDAHGHILSYGLSHILVDLRGYESLSETTAAIQKYAAENSDFPWIMGRGWNQVLWSEKTFPSRYDLDQISEDKPVWLERIDGHAGWANSKALEVAGITRESAKNNDLILKDSEGVPTGILIDKAMALMYKHVPEINQHMKIKAIKLAFNDLKAAGLTFVHDAGINQENYQMFKDMAEKGDFPIRVYAMIASDAPQFKSMVKQGLLNIDNHLIIRSVKLMIDGALGSYGAMLHEPYSDDPAQQGAFVQSPDQIKAALDFLVPLGFQANVHAIGDKGNTEVIDLLSRKSMNSSTLRHRIEHAQILRLNDIKKFKQHDLIASMQPTHATSDMNMAEDRLGAERIKGAYAWQKLFKAGVVVASGSDFPVELINPFHGIHAAVTRQNHKNMPEGGWYQNEAMTVEQALQSFTINVAFAGHAEAFSGSLDVGKQADFIVVDQDIFKINPQDIWKTQVQETWVAGQKVYASQTD